MPPEDVAGVIAPDLAGHDVGDVAASAARSGDGVDEVERLLRQGDVRPDEGHRVSPSV
jgi:hypothetical protein